MPTVTLANHTSILTGRYPGHHGILHNAWWDREHGEQVITNSQATWPWSMQHLFDGVESMHHAVHRTWPDACTASVNEPCDIGADYSTFDFFRRGDVPPMPTTPDGLPHVTERFVRPSKDYSWSSVVDHMGVEQAVGIWSGEYRGVSYPPPRFMWCNFTLTDSAFHEGGPHSEIAEASVRDTDARIGEVLDAVERAGVFDDTAFVVVADHGMQQTDPAVTGDWDVALARRRHPVPRRGLRIPLSRRGVTALQGCADGLADEEGDCRDDRADEGHPQPRATGVPAREDRRGRAGGEERDHRHDGSGDGGRGAASDEERDQRNRGAQARTRGTTRSPRSTVRRACWGRARAPPERACRARRRIVA